MQCARLQFSLEKFERTEYTFYNHDEDKMYQMAFVGHRL